MTSFPTDPGQGVPVTHTTVREPLNHILALDGLRGVAVLLVMAYHLLWANSHTANRIAFWLLKFREAGWIGVDLFFVLSGFLITGILYETLEDRNFFRNFYLRRVLRIFPLYYGVLLLVLVIVRPHTHQEKVQTFALLAYLQNTSLYWSAVTSLRPYTGHLWSLAVEEQFYMVWPFVIFFIRSRRFLLWTTVFFSVVALCTRIYLVTHGADMATTYHLTICRADSLLAGSWLALIVRGRARERVIGLAPFVFLLSAVACCAFAWHIRTLAWQTSRAINLYAYSLIAVCSTSLVAWCLQPRSRVALFMSHPLLRFFGRYSYGLYVYHILLPALLLSWVPLWLAAHVHSAIGARLALLAIEVPMIVVGAVLSFHFFERPFLRLKRFFNYDARRPAAATPLA
jgi:peptidoglycan/LPS O-acetylase OafA/YrhL